MAESLLTGLICSSMKLKDSKAPGDDGIIPEFLKNVANEISVPLGMIYTKSLAEGVVPQEWKTANVTPLFKNGSWSEPGNYRPISLTSHLVRYWKEYLKNI